MGEATAGDPSRRPGLASFDVAAGAGSRAEPGGAAGQSTTATIAHAVRHELRGALRPSELAEAAVLGDLGLVLEVLGWFVPLVGAAFQGLAIVPFAALAARQRARTAVVAMFAASSVSFLVGGVGIVVETAIAGSLGLAVGTAYRRRWNPATAVLIATVTAGIPVAVLSLVGEALSPGLRRLAFAQVEILWHDVRAGLKLVGSDSLASSGDQTLRWVIDHWWLTVPLFELFAIVLAAALCARYLWPFLVRLEHDSPAPAEASPWPGPDTVVHAGAAAGIEAADRAPVPVELDQVSYQYPGSNAWAIAQVSLSVEPRSFLAVVGPNGSGKSTLVRLVAGRLSPTLGTVRRAGDPGLGVPGGTSMIFQRPESQVLGVRARDDVVWGLPPTPRPDVGALLARVGLAGFEERETAGLSGGELQRLAIAACLAREPRLLISDEATAMIDGPGRAEVVALLESLAAAGIPAVPEWSRKPQQSSLRVRGLGYVYADGTPWARRALEDVDLDLHRGEGIVVTGDNGSGKSTLAWILAGLLAPTEGEVLLEGQPVVAGTGAVGISFQHARLQLIRPTVLSDVAYGADKDRATAALRSVGLDPVTMGPRRVDELSGGEQRRVALAGLLVRDPVLLVLDEPYAGLDDEARAGLATILARLRDEQKMATVVVSHDLDNAELLGDRLVILESGRGVGERTVGSGA